MAIFSDLPNELIQQIINNIFSDDFERFMLVSRRIYELCSSRIEEHRQFKQIYTTISLPSKFDFVVLAPRHPRPIELAGDVIARPGAAEYVRNVSFYAWVSGWNEHGIYAKPSVDLFTSLNHFIYERMMLPSQSEAEQCVACVEAGSEDPIIAMLLLLLPKLTEISLASGEDNLYINQILNWIISHPASGVLSKLEKVTMDYMDDLGEDRQLTFASVRLLALLPSIRRLILKGGPEKPFALDDPQCVQFGVSNVTSLEIECKMNLTSIVYLLEPMHFLRQLSIRYLNRTIHSTNQILDPSSIVSKLKHFNSLEELTLISDDPSPTTTPMAHVGRLVSLKEMNIDSRVLFASAVPSRVSSLADVLPRVLERLEIMIKFQPDLKREDLLKILEQVSNFKTSLARGFRSLTIVTVEDLLSDVALDFLRDDYKAQGIELVYQHWKHTQDSADR